MVNKLIEKLEEILLRELNKEPLNPKIINYSIEFIKIKKEIDEGVEFDLDMEKFLKIGKEASK